MEQPIIGEILPKPIYVDLRNKLEGLDPPEIIRVEANLVAADKWEEMVKQTQADTFERGIVVSKKGDKILTSKIFEGWQDEEGVGRIGIPFFAHGVRHPLLAHRNAISLVHSHFMPSEVDHLKTSTFLLDDLNHLATFPCNAYVMIDRGGAHVVIKRKEYLDKNIDGRTIFDNAFSSAEKSGNFCTDEVRKNMAVQLRAGGYYYFYTPNLKPSPDGFIDLKSCAPISRYGQIGS